MKCLLPFLSFVLFTSCTKEEVIPAPCGPAIVIDADRASNESDGFTLLSATEEDLCLTVTIVSTGCGSQGWTLELVTNGNVAESLPTQTGARLLFDDGIEAGEFTCQAEIEATYYFDLSPFLVSGALPTRFSILDTERVLEIE